jgi:hypothetical protein
MPQGHAAADLAFRAFRVNPAAHTGGTNFASFLTTPHVGVNAMNRTHFSGLLLLSALAANGCVAGSGAEGDVSYGNATAQAPKLDVNDVSLLFPIAWNANDRGQMLSLSDSATQGALLTKTMFDSAFSTIATQHPLANSPALALAKPYEPWRVVAVRFDPCAPHTDNAKACALQLRLVVQPIVDMNPDIARYFDKASVGALDYAMHLAFELPASDAAKAVAELRALKASSPVATTGRVLHVHPAMAQEGIAGGFAARLKKFILNFAGEKRLSKITVFGGNEPTTRGEGTRWAFSENIIAGGKLTPAALLGCGAAKVQVFDSGNFETNAFLPIPTTQNSLDTYFTREMRTESFTNKTGPLHSKAERARTSIENPGLQTIANTDCVSCHLAQVQSKGRPEGVAVADLQFKAPAGKTVARSAFLADKGYVFRMFGHVQTQLGVAQRVINESAVTADYIDRTFP